MIQIHIEPDKLEAAKKAHANAIANYIRLKDNMYQQACGLRHLAFCVDSVEQTVRELAEVGIECEPIRVDDYTGKKMTFFHDPDGLPLELHE